MKIAILTQPLTTNYGGLLQAYALQHVLRNEGHSVVTVDRRKVPHDSYSVVYKMLSYAKRLAERRLLHRNVSTLWDNHITTAVYDEISKNIRPFIVNNIQLTAPYTSDRQLKGLAKDGFDAYVVGSDQCWRPDYVDNVETFFLNFLPARSSAKRIAYAASFGVDVWEYSEDQTKKCARLAALFNAISVRENTGVALCKTYLNLDAKHVLDPTLLLCPETYESLMGNDISGVESRLAVYMLDPSPSKLQAVNRIATAMHLTPRQMMPQSQFRRVGRMWIEDCVFDSVEHWLQTVRYSDAVITDSFHGVVFSILFNKPFIAVGNHGRGLTRFTSLLSQFGLMDRLVLSPDEMTAELMSRPIDYPRVNKTLDALRRESLDFLLNALR